jgi:hypothetical protein
MSYESDFLEELAQQIEDITLEIATHEGGKFSHTLESCAGLRLSNFEHTKKVCADIVRKGII